MTSLWKALTAIAALVFVASAVWLVVTLLNGDGAPLLAVAGLIVAAVVLLLARVRWLSARGVFYEEIEDDEDTGSGPAQSAPVTRGWGGSFTGPNAASGGPLFRPAEDEASEPEEAPKPAARPAAPSARFPETPSTSPPLPPDDFDIPTFLRPRLSRKEKQPTDREPAPELSEPGSPAAPAPAAPAPPAEAEPPAQSPGPGGIPSLRQREPNPPQAPAAPFMPETPVAETPGMPAAPEPPQTPEPARFAAYYPRDVKPHHWQPLRAYMLRASASQAVQADALAQFGPRTDIRATTREALRPVAEDALVTAIPSLPGFEFDPPQVSLRFRGGWRRFDFEFQAALAPLDASTDGHITFLVEGVIVADVPISVYVTLTAGESELRPQMALSEPYQAIFCSYSHKDSAIVERVERASRYFNFRYLRDVTALRSGEVWNARLLELIDSADIFQLFWSRHAAESEYVRQEVQYAVALRRKGAKSPVFIRPIRWEEPMPAPPPPELSDLHFDLIPELAQEEPRDEMDLF